MVIVVPSFSTAEYGQNETVFTTVVGFVPDSTDQMCEGVNEESTMVQCGRRNKHTPDKTWEAPDAIDEQRIAERRDPIKPIEETDFRVATKIPHKIQIGSHIICGKYPSNVRKPPSSFQRGMHIFFLIRVFMVMPMVGRPPQHTLLCGCHGEERQDKLECPAGLERAMGKIPVVSRRDSNHSQIIAADSEQNPFPSNTSLKSHEAHQMDAQKWNDVPILNKILPGPAWERTVGMMGYSVHPKIVAPS